MSFVINLTKEDFDSTHWQKEIESSVKKECYQYKKVFDKLIKRSIEKGDEKSQYIFSLLGSIASLTIENADFENPFIPRKLSPYPKSMALENMSDEIIKLFIEVFPEVLDPEMKARILEVIWVKTKDYKKIEVMAEAYLGSFENLFDPNNWSVSFTRIERAIFIANKGGRDKAIFKKTLEIIDNKIQDCLDEDLSYLPGKLINLLLNYKVKSSSSKYIRISKKLAELAEKEKDWGKAKFYWKCKADLHSLLKDHKENRESMLSRAEVFSKQADSMLLKDPPSFTMAAVYLAEKMEALRSINHTKELVREVHTKLLKLQSKTKDEMIYISAGEVDVSETVEFAIEIIKGKALREKFHILATYCSSPSKEKLQKQLERRKNLYILEDVLPDVLLDKFGRVISKNTNEISEIRSEHSKISEDKLFRSANFYRECLAVALIEPMRIQIVIEHEIMEESFLSLVYNNIFIPPGREEIYIKGLSAGFNGDLITSNHLLIPQLENSLRYLLKEAGIVTSYYDVDGIQEEKSLSSLLLISELTDLVGNDVVFDLKGLLIERFGLNLRNKIAHGLLDYDNFNSSSSLYLWWLTFSLCYKFRKNQYK